MTLRVDVVPKRKRVIHSWVQQYTLDITASKEFLFRVCCVFRFAAHLHLVCSLRLDDSRLQKRRQLVEGEAQELRAEPQVPRLYRSSVHEIRSNSSHSHNTTDCGRRDEQTPNATVSNEERSERATGKNHTVTATFVGVFAHIANPTHCQLHTLCS